MNQELEFIFDGVAVVGILLVAACIVIAVDRIMRNLWNGMRSVPPTPKHK